MTKEERIVLRRFETMNREWSAEVLVYADGRVAYRQSVDPAEPVHFSECSWEAVAAGWPSNVVNLGGSSTSEELDRFLVSAIAERDGGRQGCSVCGSGPVVARECVSAVHPVSGDGYGTIERTCLACRHDKTPFSDN